ncbi:MAG: DUF4159 domain-containing protein [Notoacmeibacter sp.]|nr:DUF4159 domain-containing protein [Notoacmeibacter sp.]MCC0033373.1 DUF4159 domain-containing protein [Brucellaceae bacterium]
MLAGLTFTAPWLLAGLVTLPVIWWLLRMTPPRPKEEVFAPLKILARVLKPEETPHQSPWWLTLLRLVMAALVILALAGPVWNPQGEVKATGDDLAILLDNGWSSAPDFAGRKAAALSLIEGAADRNQRVFLALTAERPGDGTGPFDAASARDRLAAAVARPVPVDRAAHAAALAKAMEGTTGGTLALLTDGLAVRDDAQAFGALAALAPASVIWAEPDLNRLAAITHANNGAASLDVTVIRPQGVTGAQLVTLAALDSKGRRIAEAEAAFDATAGTATASFAVPFELRNDFADIFIEGAKQAGATRVLDDNQRRRRVGLLAAIDADSAQPLLSPLFYIRRALGEFADVVEPAKPELDTAIAELIEQKPAVIVMADVGVIPDEAREKLTEFVEGGGTLVRFAGPRMAAANEDDGLLPVRLRTGERALGGTLSWTEPQAVTSLPETGGFAGLPAPQDVTVTRQVLAEPDPDIVERTWAALGDGTPLVTGAPRGQGTLVLFHVTPEATWSNLPITGSFVEMLRRIVQFSRNQGAISQRNAGQAPVAVPPYRMIGADGTLTTPPPDARPLDLTQAAPAVTLDNPPGLYGSAEGVVAHNLLKADAVLAPLARPAFAASATTLAYGTATAARLKGPLLAVATALLALDSLIMLVLSGAFARRGRAAMAAGLAALALLAATPDGLRAQDISDARPGDAEAIAAITRTRIAYVLTGNGGIDSVSRAGLAGLNRFLIEKTALEPGEPAGVDIAKDELAFYPILYWPIDASVPAPDTASLARIDAYMKNGGTVLFDTRDALSSGFGGTSPANQRLREILSAMNVPPLEPVPADHVLTKSFFILSGFPGRYNSSPLWVEASLSATNEGERPVRTGDGVSPILITGNDMAGAWAIGADGNYILPTVPNSPLQRIYALRAGVNIMMYMLTGNYKADQVHIPALLERLGQ